MNFLVLKEHFWRFILLRDLAMLERFEEMLFEALLCEETVSLKLCLVVFFGLDLRML